MTTSNRIPKVTLTVLVLLASCGGSDRAEPPPSAAPPTALSTTTTGTTTTTTAPPTAEQEVEQAYLGIMERLFRREETPDPSDPTLADDLTGETFLRVTDYLTTARDRQLGDCKNNGVTRLA